MASSDYKRDKYLGRIHGKTNVKIVGTDTISASSFHSTDTVSIDSDSGDVSFKDGGTAQLDLDMDGTAGQVDIQLKVDGDDLVLKQFDGYEVARVHDNSGIGGFTSRKVVVDIDDAFDLSDIDDAIPYSGAIFSVEMNGSEAYAITLPTATSATEGKRLTGWHVSIILTAAAAENVTVIRGDTSNDIISGIVLSGDATPNAMTISGNIITFVGSLSVISNRVDITCWSADATNTKYVAQGFCGV